MPQSPDSPRGLGPPALCWPLAQGGEQGPHGIPADGKSALGWDGPTADPTPTVGCAGSDEERDEGQPRGADPRAGTSLKRQSRAEDNSSPESQQRREKGADGERCRCGLGESPCPTSEVLFPAALG